MRCPSCFADKTRVICEHCGFDESEGPREMCLPFHYPLDRGRYSVGVILGNPGGFGVAYKAWDHELHAVVVIKEFQGVASDHVSRTPGDGWIQVDDEAADEYLAGLDNFRFEADVTQRFGHRCIVQVRRFFSENNTCYYVMPFVESGDLRAYMADRNRHVPPDEVMSLARDLLAALIVVHGKGYLHCDIKPSNVLVTHKKKAILIDFGAAWKKGAEEGPRHYSEKYAPPELLKRSVPALGDWTDIYLLCATLYECLAGEPPPQAKVRSSAKKDPLIPIEDHPAVGSMDSALAEFINGGLALSVGMRPQDADTALRMLEGETATDSETEEGDDHTTIEAETEPETSRRPTTPQWVALAPLLAAIGMGMASSDPSAYFNSLGGVLLGGYALAWAVWVFRGKKQRAPETSQVHAVLLTCLWEDMEPVTRTLLAGESLVVGRSAKASLRIANNRLSAEHVRITLSASGECTVEDLDSTNGTFIEVLTRHRLEWHRLDDAIDVSDGRFMLGLHDDGGVLLDIRPTTVASA